MIDHLDDKIIEILKKDSRRPFVEIANELEVSEGTIRSRVKKLFDEGVIQAFTIKTSSKNVKALVEVKIDVNVNTSDIAAKIADQDQMIAEIKQQMPEIGESIRKLEDNLGLDEEESEQLIKTMSALLRKR
jgi:DNA-binding Lrp family transcriptional regulator